MIIFMLSAFQMLSFFQDSRKDSEGSPWVKVSRVLEKALGLKPDGTILRVVYYAVPNTSVFKGINIVVSVLMNLIKKTDSHQSK